MPTFLTREPISATVDIVFGDIRFTAADRGDTVVEVRPADPSWALDVKAAAQTDVAYTDGKLLVKQPKLRNLWTAKCGAVEVLVRLPTGSHVHGDTAKGDFVVEGAVGTCRLKTPTGDIRVAQAGQARLRTTGGTVAVDHVTGDADISGNGDIQIGRVDGAAVVKNISGRSRVGEVGGDLRMNSANGLISIDVARAAVRAKTATGGIRVGEAGDGDVDLFTATGEVEIGVRQGTAAIVDARASAGRVRNYLDAAPHAGGTVKVRARSHGGDITVRRA